MKRGDRFEHARQLDLTWTPGPGQRYADAPHAVCTVTRVAQGLVWYGGFVADEADMVEGGPIVRRWLS